jgi:geranylgeranyl pyrophosphate synthase
MTAHTVSLESFFDTTLQDVENKIKQLVDDPKILQILHGGKRLRPLLAALSFKVCTGGTEEPSRYQAALEGAVGIELAHNASLVHDDIIDGDVNRRGELAFYITEGVDNAILIGHKMLVIGFNMAISHGDKIARLYIDTWNKTLSGQLTEVNFNTRDINNGDQITISADSKFFRLYSTIIDLKTASLFSSACKAAAYEAEVSEELSDLLYDYGRGIGFAYQLADDLVDLEKGEMIDSVVLPLINRLEKKSIKNGSLKAKTLKKKLEQNSDEIKQLYIDEIKKHIDHSRQLSKSPLIPSNPYTTLLQQAPSYIINKMLKEIQLTI